MDSPISPLFKKFRDGADGPPVLAQPRDALAWLEGLVGFPPDGLGDPRLAGRPDLAVFPLPEGQLQVDVTREAAARAARMPEGAWQALVVEGLDRATPQAGNNLLKLFEELPPRTFVVATARNALKVLPTLRSRMAAAGSAATAPELDPALAAKVDGFLAGDTMDLPAFLLDKKSEIGRDLAADLIAYAMARAGRFPKAAAALPRMAEALRTITTSNANVRAQLDQAFLTLL